MGKMAARSRTIVLVTIAAAILAIAAAGCIGTNSQETAAEIEAKRTTEGTTEAKSEEEDEPLILRTDVSEKGEIVAAALKIDELRKVDNPDYTEIESIFKSDLKEMVSKRDGEAQTSLVADIESAIVDAKAGQDVALNGQRISKTLIRAFYLAVKHELEETEANFSDKTEKGAFHKWDEAEAYFGGLSTSGFFEENPDLIGRVEEAFEDGRAAIAADDILAMKLAAQVIDKISIRFFVGSVLREADAAVGLDEGEALEKIVEAQVFHSAVADKFEAYDEQIKAALSSVETAKPAELRALLAQGLADKVVHEAEEVTKNWGTDKAAVVALEGSLYMEALADVLGADRSDEANAILERLSLLEAAVDAEDKAEAERLIEEVTADINNINADL